MQETCGIFETISVMNVSLDAMFVYIIHPKTLATVTTIRLEPAIKKTGYFPNNCDISRTTNHVEPYMRRLIELELILALMRKH